MPANFHSNLGQYLNASDEAVHNALTVIGTAAEGHAKENVTEMRAVDTGFLRNSITWAISGETTNARTYKDDSGQQEGSYSGDAPAATEGQKSVWIGSNVFYAPHVEYGTEKMAGRPYLRRAISDHADEYKAMLRDILDSTDV